MATLKIDFDSKMDGLCAFFSMYAGLRMYKEMKDKQHEGKGTFSVSAAEAGGLLLQMQEEMPDWYEYSKKEYENVYCKETVLWNRYNFKTKSVDDYRPLIFDKRYPWWCSAENDDYVTIVAFLPKTEDLKKYWDDAFDVEFTEHSEIKFTGRFPRPDYFVES